MSFAKMSWQHVDNLTIIKKNLRFIFDQKEDF